MQAEAIFLPVSALVLLTFLVWLRMYLIRFGEARKHGLAPEDMNKLNPRLPRRFATSGDNFSNLFELPVLFYLLAILLFLTHRVDPLYDWLAWAFVASRYLHSLIHTTYNRVLHRFCVYALGALVLWLMWARFAIQLLNLA